MAVRGTLRLRRFPMMVYTFLMMILSAALVWPLFIIGDVIHNIGDALFVGFIFGGTLLIMWSVSWRSTIQVTDDFLIICNMFRIHEIPWSDVQDILLNEGIKVYLNSGEKVSSIQFGDSLLGAMTGYPSYKRSVVRLEKALAEHEKVQHSASSVDVQKRSRFSFPWGAAIGWYLFFFVPAIASLFFFK